MNLSSEGELVGEEGGREEDKNMLSLELVSECVQKKSGSVGCGGHRVYKLIMEEKKNYL